MLGTGRADDAPPPPELERPTVVVEALTWMTTEGDVVGSLHAPVPAPTDVEVRDFRRQMGSDADYEAWRPVLVAFCDPDRARVVEAALRSGLLPPG